MVKGVQFLCHMMGEGACYEFSLTIAAERERQRSGALVTVTDPLAMHVSWLRDGVVLEDCTVMHGALIMESLCRGKWVVLKAGDGKDSAGRPYDLPLDYQLQPGEYDIHRYERKLKVSPGHEVLKGHFFYAGPGELEDPWGESETRLRGYLVSRRIVRRVG